MTDFLNIFGLFHVLMLEPRWIRSFYINGGLKVPELWRLSRKHFRVETAGGRFLKLNRFRSRLNMEKLRELCARFSPIHVYFSVLDWLFPERVGKKCKAKYAVPVGGEYVVDVDSYVFKRRHRHVRMGLSGVCVECLQTSKALTVQACEAIEEYYADIAIVFSGRRGFHIHVLDFNVHDWTTYNERNPIKSHEAARFKFSKTVDLETYVFDRHHFILSVDPMRVISVPNSLNAETGLKCIYVGDRKDLENMTINSLLYHANPALEIYGHPEPAGAVK
jgi:DNA primase catalytic subunit